MCINCFANFIDEPRSKRWYFIASLFVNIKLQEFFEFHMIEMSTSYEIRTNCHLAQLQFTGPIDNKRPVQLKEVQHQNGVVPIKLNLNLLPLPLFSNSNPLFTNTPFSVIQLPTSWQQSTKSLQYQRRRREATIPIFTQAKEEMKLPEEPWDGEAINFFFFSAGAAAPASPTVAPPLLALV